MGYLYGKATGNSLGGPTSWVMQGLRNQLGGVNSVNQVDGD